jgi:hypothetical protein
LAEGVEQLARIRRMVAAGLREVGRSGAGSWLDRRAAQVERDAQQAHDYACGLRRCAERLTGLRAWPWPC